MKIMISETGGSDVDSSETDVADKLPEDSEVPNDKQQDTTCQQ